MSVLMLTTDLMLPSQLAGAAAQCGASLDTAANAESLLQAATEKQPRLVLLDLSLRGIDVATIVQSLKALPHPPAVIAYGPHVQEALLQSAREAGCREVLARGQVFRDFPVLLAKYVPDESSGRK